MKHVTQKIKEGKVCPYCGDPTVLINSRLVYHTDRGMLWYCHPCQAWSKTKRGVAIGPLADPHLRYLRRQTHYAIKAAATKLNISYKQMLIECKLSPDTKPSILNERQCEHVIALCKKAMRT